MVIIPGLNLLRIPKGLMKTQRWQLALMVWGWFCVAWSALPAKAGSLKPYEFSLIRMGTSFRIVLYSSDPNLASQAASEAFERVEQLEQIFSDYREDSELLRVCRKASQSPQLVSSELFQVLKSSLYFSELSDGAFDVTIGPVVKLWREARRNKRLPDAEQLSNARQAVGYQNIVLDPTARTVFLKRDDMRLDLGAIAKGYATDQALRVLESYGIRSALVDGGGDLSLGDSPPGTRGWDIQIHTWTGEPATEHPWLQLHNVAIATSGDAFQYLEAKGQHFSHIINPSEGLGLRDSVSTTVIAPDGTTADALATTLSILPVPRALSLADSLESVSAFLVRRKGKELSTFTSQKFPRFVKEVTLHAGGKHPDVHSDYVKE
jgi:thiamine biosynthesis lipoprotein